MKNNHFTPAWWLPNPHFQTLWSSRLRRKIKIPTQKERLELPDGDFLDLAWAGENKGPIVIVLHGLTGSLNSSYIRGILKAISAQGFRGVLLHFRGCSGTPNRLARSYHSGETNDLNYVIQKLRAKEPNTPLFAVGYSLGANVLLKYLGEFPQDNPLQAAVAISIPFELEKTVAHLNQGFSRLYQWHLLRELRNSHQEKSKTIPDLLTLRKVKTLFEFDDNVTAPLHGFKNAQDYYTKSSSRQYLKSIQTPTLILHACDDPFTPPNALPTENEISKQVSLELTQKGGHVGFVSGKFPWKAEYWLEKKILHYLKDHCHFDFA